MCLSLLYFPVQLTEVVNPFSGFDVAPITYQPQTFYAQVVEHCQIVGMRVETQILRIVSDEAGAEVIRFVALAPDVPLRHPIHTAGQEQYNNNQNNRGLVQPAGAPKPNSPAPQPAANLSKLSYRCCHTIYLQ